MVVGRIEQIADAPEPIHPFAIEAPPESPRAGIIADMMLGFVAIAYRYDSAKDRTIILSLQLLEGPHDGKQGGHSVE